MNGSDGLGWAVILIDTLCSEYGWTLDYVMGWNLSPANLDRGISLAEACMLITAISLKYGRRLAEPSYKERELLKEFENGETQCTDRS